MLLHIGRMNIYPNASNSADTTSFYHTRGSISNLYQLRSLVGYALIVLAGTMLAWMPLSIPWQSFGLGLIVPGGSYLMYLSGDATQISLHLLYFSIALSSFAASVFIWFATGNIIAPPLIWLLLAFVGGFAGHGGVHDLHQPAIWENARILLPALAILLVAMLGAIIVSASRQKHTFALEQIDESLLNLEGVRNPKWELDPADLARLRFLLDRALQPVSEFQGFEWLDQFQSAAIRYQLNFAGYALALVHHCHLPAFKGYMVDAQANLIEKQRNKKVWKYWWLENLWGNMRLNANPVGKDNIMYTGFCATQIGLFQAATGDGRFSQPGAFSLTSKNGENWKADFGTLADNLNDQYTQSKYGLIACEPNWIFPACNAISFLALTARDKQFGTQYWCNLAKTLRHRLQTEFTNKRGEYVPCRSSRTGITIPFIGGALAKLLPNFFLNGTFPDLARQNWLRIRSQILSFEGGHSKVKLTAFWPIDVGNYRFTQISGIAGVAAIAGELGDDEARELFLNELDTLYPELTHNGVAHRPHASIWSHSMEVIARCSRKNALRDLVSTIGDTSGPFIKSCTYPNVLVARAVAMGNQLEAVFYPGSDQPAQSIVQSIVLGGLIPSAAYSCAITRLEFTSKKNGEASLQINLTDRVEICVQPVGDKN